MVRTLTAQLTVMIDELLSMEEEKPTSSFDEMTWPQAERMVIESVLKRHNGCRMKTAKQLQIGRQTLYNRIKVYGLNGKDALRGNGKGNHEHKTE